MKKLGRVEKSQELLLVAQKISRQETKMKAKNQKYFTEKEVKKKYGFS